MFVSEFGDNEIQITIPVTKDVIKFAIMFETFLDIYPTYNDRTYTIINQKPIITLSKLLLTHK